ncbi:hypothetical protein [Pseudomonas ogarae]
MPTENMLAKPSCDRNKPPAGREYIAKLFETALKRQDYRQYIKECLAGDFACTLAQHFEAIEARESALQQRLNAADQRNDELARDKARLDALESNFWDVRFDSSPNGDAGDSSTSIEIVGHWMDKPSERVIGENYSENLRAAIDQAMKAPAYPPERPEYPEPTSDDDWHMNPCKQGHRDVGAAGGVAHCHTSDEKIEAATTQEAFELWNATHPAAQP